MKLRAIFVLLAALAIAAPVLLMSRPHEVAAHPLGNFTINRLAKIELLSTGETHVRYVLDIAEIPAFQELREIDSNGDDAQSDAEISAYLARTAPELLSNIELKVNGRNVALNVASSSASFPDGQGGLKTVRLVFDLSGALPDGWKNGVNAEFKDDNYASRVGWREIVVLPTEGVALTQTSAATADDTAELTAYPVDRLKSPPTLGEASFRFAAGDASTIPSTVQQKTGSASKAPARSLDRFARLVTRDHLTPAFVALALLAAMAWGAAHALGPGHGKTIVAAYLVGTRGTVGQAVILGVTVTLTHTSSVLFLGLLTLSASRFVSTEDVYLWLSLGSGLLVIAMGGILFATRLRSALRGRSILPSPDAHEHDDHDHDHDHPHEHEHEHGHSHVPTKPGLRGLIALGISGGILPCPTALVVMLGAIALDRIVYGIALVLAFGVGLAGVLTGIGILFVCANRFVRGRGLISSRAATLALRVAPVLGSFVIMIAGVLLTTNALASI